MEANPSDIIDKVDSLKTAGVNRLSLGVQSLNDTSLRFFNRDHDVKQAWQSIDACLKTFSSRLSVDLIFGLPGQSVEDWRKELNKIVDSGTYAVFL